MTRGTFVLITNDRVFISIQFNGDMYFWEPGHGNDAMATIRNIRKPEDFEVAILEFNRMHHDYDLDEDKAIEAVVKLDGNEIDIAGNRWLRWTDYTFYKNASDKDIVLHCEDEDVSLRPYCSMALCYGKPDYKNIPEKYWRNYPEQVEAPEDPRPQTPRLIQKTEYRRLFIIRKDLQMSPGKLASQVAHCAEAYWLHIIRSWEVGQIGMSRTTRIGDYRFTGDLDGGIYENYLNGTITKTICEARNKNHLLKAKEKAVEMGLKEGADFGLIRDLCLTELEPEDEDGRTTTGIWFRPLPDDVAHEISRKYQLYK